MESPTTSTTDLNESVPKRFGAAQTALVIAMIFAIFAFSVYIWKGDTPKDIGWFAYYLAILSEMLAWYAASLPIPLVYMASAVCLGFAISMRINSSARSRVRSRDGSSRDGSTYTGLIATSVSSSLSTAPVSSTQRSTLPQGVAASLGVGLMLALTHALWWLAGYFGGLHGTTAIFAAWALIFGPIIWCLIEWRASSKLLTASQKQDVSHANNFARKDLKLLYFPLLLGLFLLPPAIVPPGILWASEYGGYDALSYHLPLAQEWYAAGSLAPVAHNVYSYLPSYVESAFVHLAAMSGAPQSASSTADGVTQQAVGLLFGDGRLLLSCQILQVLMLCVAASSVCGLAMVIARRFKMSADDAEISGEVAAIFVMTTPWLVVVSTIAYNEAAMMSLIAAALACAISTNLSPRARGVLCGVLMGLACCVKPTALVMGAPAVGIAMLVGCWNWSKSRDGYDALRAKKHIAICIALCLITGTLILSPWLIRNASQGGNPVFPFASSTFGSAHWSSDQASRYAAAHKPDRGTLDALALLIAPDSRVLADAPAIQRWRGLTNFQWMLVAPLGLLSILALLVWRSSRAIAVTLALGLASQALAWALFTHAQSRFLIPMAPVLAASASIAAVMVLLWARTREINRLEARKAAQGNRPQPWFISTEVTLYFCVTGLGMLYWFYMSLVVQHVARSTSPMQSVFSGPSAFTASSLAHALASARKNNNQSEASAIMEAAEPSQFLALLPGIRLDRVLLIGSATPLYFGPVAYSTTWDSWPITRHIAAAPAEPASWTRGLHADGYDVAIVDMSEVSRLFKSGYLDPRLTPETLLNWMGTSTRLIRAWDKRGVFIVDLRPTATNPSLPSPAPTPIKNPLKLPAQLPTQSLTP